jgi:DNA polymerase-3 subunit beta
VRLTSKLIDGTFPEYERVIPRDNDKVLRVAKKDFAEAVARVSAISTERSRPVKMALERDLLTLSAASPEQGSATEELGFQARYLNDITDQIGGEVEFLFSDGSAPTVVRDAGDPSALYVLMPMRV